MRIPGLVLAYHGCDQSVATKILSGRSEVISSRNSYDWLGSGAYFWENNPSRALSWARSLALSKSNKVQTPAVVGAILDPGYCLDLTEESSLGLVKVAFEGFRRLGESLGIALPRNEPGFENDADLVKRHLDCAVLNFLHESRKAGGLRAYDSVECPVRRGRGVVPGFQTSEQNPRAMVHPRSQAQHHRLFPSKGSGGHRDLISARPASPRPPRRHCDRTLLGKIQMTSDHGSRMTVRGHWARKR